MRKYIDIIRKNEQITEILKIGTTGFQLKDAEERVDRTQPIGHVESYQLRFGKENMSGSEFGVFMLVVEDTLEVAAICFMEILNNGQLWQERAIQVFDSHRKQALIAKLYKHLIDNHHITLMSDMQHSGDSRNLWTKTLPRMGLYPKVYDAKSNKIVDNPPEDAIKLVYGNDNIGNEQFCWIISE